MRFEHTKLLNGRSVWLSWGRYFVNYLTVNRWRFGLRHDNGARWLIVWRLSFGRED